MPRMPRSPRGILVALLAAVAVLALVVMAMGAFPGMEDLGVGGGLLGGVYLVFAFLYFFPSLYLFRYAGAIRRIGPRRSAAAAEEALGMQLKFWRFVGIMMAALMVVYALMIALGVVAAIMGAATTV